MKDIAKKVISSIGKGAKSVASLSYNFAAAQINAKNQEAQAAALQNQEFQQRNFQGQLGCEVGKVLSFGSGAYTSFNVNVNGVTNLSTIASCENRFRFGLIKNDINKNLTNFQQDALMKRMNTDLIKFGNAEYRKYGNFLSGYYPILSMHKVRILSVRDTGVELCIEIQVF